MEEISIEELVKFVGQLLNYDGKYGMLQLILALSTEDVQRFQKQKDLGYFPKISWKEGVTKTIHWYKDFLKNNKDLHESFYDKKD